MLVEDYADRVAAAARHVELLLRDEGTRVDNPSDEPVAPGDDALELDPAVATVIEVSSDPATGVTFAAVDGGSACLANGRSFWVIAYRSGTIWHRDRVTVAENVDPLVLRTLTQTDAGAEYAAALAGAGQARDRQLSDLGGVVDVLRELAEWRRVREAIEQSRPGDIVLVDGSLHAGPFLPATFVAPYHEAALDRRVDLVGVTKGSKLRWGRFTPLVLRVRRRAERELGPDRRWYLQVTKPVAAGDANGWGSVAPDEAAGGSASGHSPWRCDVFVARLARRGAYAFRVDTVRGARTPDELFAALAGASDDPAVLGYPYPLARVHQLVALPPHLLGDLRRDLRAACVRAGIPDDDVDLVLRDFHLTLNA